MLVAFKLNFNVGQFNTYSNIKIWLCCISIIWAYLKFKKFESVFVRVDEVAGQQDGGHEHGRVGFPVQAVHNYHVLKYNTERIS